jgi:hypothetical protein
MSHLHEPGLRQVHPNTFRRMITRRVVAATTRPYLLVCAVLWAGAYTDWTVTGDCSRPVALATVALLTLTVRRHSVRSQVREALETVDAPVIIAEVCHRIRVRRSRERSVAEVYALIDSINERRARTTRSAANEEDADGNHVSLYLRSILNRRRDQAARRRALAAT